MGKVSPNERQSRSGRHKRKSKNSNNKYLKPGALAQLRNSKASASKSCMDLGKKRVGIVDSKHTGSYDADIFLNKDIDKSPEILSPERFEFAPGNGHSDVLNQNNLQRTPKTPCSEERVFESRLESLPIDLLVKILCNLHHDQLRAVFHVSEKIRKAVVIARQFHFNYTTPDRARQEVLKITTPLPTDHWPFVSKGGGKGMWIGSPRTPKAPKHGPRPPSRLKCTEMRQIAAVLFQGSSFSSKCLVPSLLPKPVCKSLASNRALFYEDELCQAVAQNNLL
ncbi:F-box protein At4g35930-like [Primulina eburnea]|uniref:F-box protein At4g35930-like n=1 Tax=Primulina eburnea TaxID=1245227 RepID=UPI003C6CA2D5